jgi:MscS family membrane protein
MGVGAGIFESAGLSTPYRAFPSAMPVTSVVTILEGSLIDQREVRRLSFTSLRQITRRVTGACLLALCLLFCLPAWAAQLVAPAPAPATAQPEAPPDSLGRNTPKGTVLGFLIAARTGQEDVAVQYLDTRLRGKAATELARRLFTALDLRLPPRLTQLSEKPDGSLADPLKPNEERVGVISSDNGNVDIVLERVNRGKSGFLWLFSAKTLDAVPDVYDEITRASAEDVLPQFVMTTRFLGVILFNWFVLLIGMPLFYYLTGLLNRLLGPLVGPLRRHLSKNPDLPNPAFLPAPVRLLLLALALRWMITSVSLPLLARQIWSSVAVVIAIAAGVWLFILLNSWTEHYSQRFARRHDITGITALVRLVRRFVDLLVIFAGVMGILYYFGVNPTAVVAGLGVGGIAVALAAQKTLENVIGGISLILDKVVLVGDTLKVGAVEGTVEDLGLRSTRIRTSDRTVVSLPNGQVANMTLENLSTRDKFWFHPILALHYGTTTTQLHTVLESIRRLLQDSPNVEPDSVRVSFLRLGVSALEVEAVAYIVTRKGAEFLAIQEDLLLRIMECVASAGVQLATPSQTIVIDAASANEATGRVMVKPRAPDIKGG